MDVSRDRTAEELIATLEMQPHPEGGHYVETWRGRPGDGGRAIGTAINFLLRAGERSRWHRVDADEIWLFQMGAPLRLLVADAGGPPAEHVVGDPLDRPPHELQAVVPARAWQAAESTGAWSLVACVVVPGFEFDGFELAPDGWYPGSPE